MEKRGWEGRRLMAAIITVVILGVLIFLQLQSFPVVYFFVCLLLLILGFLTSGKAEEIYQQKDSGKIVIDEIAGMCLVYLGILVYRPVKIWIVLLGFLIFRFFDIIKPPPANKIQQIKGSAGVMLDDIICAVYTNLILQVLVRLLAKAKP